MSPSDNDRTKVQAFFLKLARGFRNVTDDEKRIARRSHRIAVGGGVQVEAARHQ